MIYFHFLGRQTGKTTKAIEIFNRDIDNMLVVANADLKRKIINDIRKDKSFNPKHEYLLDRKVKSMYENIHGYRCKNLIIDEPLETNLNFTGFNNTFNDKLRDIYHITEKDIIIFQSIEDPKLFEDIQISKRICDLYKIKQLATKQTNIPFIKKLNFTKDITEIIEETHHRLMMIDLLTEENNNKEIITLKEFKRNVLNLINKIPFYMNMEIIINKLPE